MAGEKYKVEVVTYDTVYAPDKTVAAINRAVYNDGVKYGVIIGAGVHPPILPIIRETGFLDLAFAAAGKQITNPENPTVFRIMASSDQLYQTYTQPVIEKLGGKRIAFLGPNDELGKNDAKAVKAEVEKMKARGVSFVAEEYYERGAKDFGPALLRLIAQKPDLIDTDGSPTGSIALIAKQARELGYKGYFVNSTAVLEAKAISDIAGKAGDNIIALRIWAKPPTPALPQLSRAAPEEMGGGGPGDAVGDVRSRALAGRMPSRRREPWTPERWPRPGGLGLRRPSLRLGHLGRREDLRGQAPDRPADPGGDPEGRQVGALRRPPREVRLTVTRA